MDLQQGTGNGGEKRQSRPALPGRVAGLFRDRAVPVVRPGRDRPSCAGVGRGRHSCKCRAMTAETKDFRQDLEDRLIVRRRENVDRCGAEALAWLVLPPVWTEELAREVPFPESPLPQAEFLAECEKLGWCVRRPDSVTARPE